MKTYRVPILDGEYWWLGVSAEGAQMPLDARSVYACDLLPDRSENQTATALLSSLGRSIRCSEGFRLRVEGGELCLLTDGRVIAEEGYGSLRGAFLHLREHCFARGGRVPPAEFFRRPQFNTWIEYPYFPTQEKVLRYAEQIEKSGFGCGILMIDCGWAPYYGSFEFNANFPDPANMMRRLHKMGFRVMLWVCPFISADSVAFRDLRERELLVRNADGTIALRQWWDGFSAVLDLTNPRAQDWLYGRLDRLMKEYGVDGFKFDAGDPFYYRDDDLTCGGGKATDSSRAWAQFGLQFTYNEFRSSTNMGGQPLVQRLKDKRHSFGRNGLASLVPSTLVQHLFGHYYTCPDMIGGGDYTAFRGGAAIDEELVVRSCQCSALMPMMQFSLAPWRVLSEENYGRIRRAVRLHETLSAEYCRLVEGTRGEAEPIVRLLEYNYPHAGLAEVADEFMIGERYLCAPVVEKGATEREVVLPPGQWRYEGNLYRGGKIVFPVDLDDVPIFEKV